jgi:site-specific DNA-methyltransferase (adenine-specific)
MKHMPSTPSHFDFDIAQRSDTLMLLQGLPDCSAAIVIFDPQHRSVLDHLKFGNEGARQVGRAALPAMSEAYIDHCLREAARILIPSSYVFLWIDTYRLCEGAHLRVADVLRPVDLIAWDSLRMGMGKRSRRRGDYVLVLQKPPVIASNWCDHGIPSRWAEKVDRRIHPHAKPTELTARLIGAVTRVGDLVVDPAAGSFTVLEIAQLMGRRFIGCDLAWREQAKAPAPCTFERVPVTEGVPI